MNCPRCHTHYGAQAEVCSRCGIVLVGRERWGRPRQAFTHRIHRRRIVRAILAAAAFPAVTFAYLRVVPGHTLLEQLLGTGIALGVGAVAYLFLRVAWTPMLLRRRRQGDARHEKERLESRVHGLEHHMKRNPDDPHLLVAAGEVNLRLGRIQRAREVLERAQELLQNNPRVQINLATAHGQLGDLQTAYRVSKELIDQGSREPQLLANAFRMARLMSAHEDALATGRLWVDADPAPPEARVQLGTLLARLGRWEEAEAELERALRECPDHPHALNNRSVIRYRRGDFGGAVADLAAALRVAPDDPEVRSNLGLLLYLQGRVDEAWQCLIDAETWGCVHPHGLRNLGLLYWKNNQVDEAVEALRAGLFLRPNSVSLHVTLGTLYLLAGAPRAALEEFKQVAAAHPRDAVARTGYGCALYELGRPERAVPEFQASAQLRPQDPRVRCNMGVAYLFLDELDRAHEELEQASRLDAGSPAGKWCAPARSPMGRPGAGAPTWPGASPPQEAQIPIKLGYYFMQVAHYYEAGDAFRKGIELDPLSFEAYVNLGIAEYLLTDLPVAEDYFRRAAELDPTSALAQHGLGLALVLRREWGKAIAALERATALDRADPDISYNLGWACYTNSRPLQGIEALNHSVALRPGDPEAYGLLGLCYAVAGLYKDAVHNFKLALEVEPKNAVTYGNMGLAYYLLKEAEEAVECWMEVVRLDPAYARRREKVQFTAFDDSHVRPHGFERMTRPGVLHPVPLIYIPPLDLVFDAGEWRVIPADQVLEAASRPAPVENIRRLDVGSEGLPQPADTS